jgi:hypothetical protein
MVTDTELQIAQFVLPRHGFSVTNETVEARTLRAFKEELSPDHVSHEKITYTVKQRANWYARSGSQWSTTGTGKTRIIIMSLGRALSTVTEI